MNQFSIENLIYIFNASQDNARILLESMKREGDITTKDIKEIEDIIFRQEVKNSFVYNLPKEVSGVIDQYISTELDYNTDGLKGIGRMTTYLPRFAGLTKEHYDKLNINYIREAFIKHILIGYLIGLSMLKDPTKTLGDINDLYQKVIPRIYNSGSITEQPHVSLGYKLLIGWVQNDLLEYLWNKTQLDKNKLSAIFQYYYFAGVILAITIYSDY